MMEKGKKHQHVGVETNKKTAHIQYIGFTVNRHNKAQAKLFECCEKAVKTIINVFSNRTERPDHWYTLIWEPVWGYVGAELEALNVWISLFRKSINVIFDYEQKSRHLFYLQAVHLLAITIDKQSSKVSMQLHWAFICFSLIFRNWKEPIEHCVCMFVKTANLFNG